MKKEYESKRDPYERAFSDWMDRSEITGQKIGKFLSKIGWKTILLFGTIIIIIVFGGTQFITSLIKGLKRKK